MYDIDDIPVENKVSMSVEGYPNYILVTNGSMWSIRSKKYLVIDRTGCVLLNAPGKPQRRVSIRVLLGKYHSNNSSCGYHVQQVPGHPGYFAHRDGRIWSAISGQWLTPVTRKDGYMDVTLNGKHYLVHRVIAMALHENPKNKPEVNHINGIKTDNHTSNLEWSTRSENMKHAAANGLLDLTKMQSGRKKYYETSNLTKQNTHL